MFSLDDHVIQVSVIMNELSQFAHSPAGAVFIGTLPLLGSIIWAMVTNNQRLTRLEGKLDHLEGKVDDLGTNINSIKVDVAVLKTRMDAPRLVG